MGAKVYQELARVRKVQAMMRYLPTAATGADVEAQADELASWDADRRRTWARAAGVNEASEATWAAFVEAARGRLAADEVTPVDHGALLFLADAKAVR